MAKRLVSPRSKSYVISVCSELSISAAHVTLITHSWCPGFTVPYGGTVDCACIWTLRSVACWLAKAINIQGYGASRDERGGLT